MRREIILITTLVCASLANQFVPFVKIPEGKKATIGCPSSTVLLIQTASYGKTLGERKLCSAYSSVTEIASRCNARRSCVLRAANDVFGDPCPGHTKELIVAYSCIQRNVLTIKSLIICERGTGDIVCPPTNRIEVYYASYGRQRRSVCTKGPQKTTQCHAKKSLRLVKARCNGRRRCKLTASNRVFGDPCSGTHKYLEVRYRCRAPCLRDTSVKSLSIPENGFASPRCPRGGRISVTAASYGIRNDPSCDKRIPYHLAAVQNRCNGVKECTLNPRNAIFGDPCRGKTKTLYIKYHCIY